VLHLCAMFGLLWSMGFIMGGFDDGVPAPWYASAVLAAVRVFWLPTGWLQASAGWGHVAGVVAGSFWIAISLFIADRARRFREVRAASR